MAMVMIEGICRTNLDGYSNEEWPKSFVSVPRKGERVRAKSGRSLKVCTVTHIGEGFITYSDGGTNANPQIEIELTNHI